MIVRGWLWMVLACLPAGCLAPQLVVHPPARKAPSESNQSSRFGEYANITGPGQLVVKAASSTPKPWEESALLRPARSEDAGTVPDRSEQAGTVPVRSQHAGTVPVRNEYAGRDPAWPCREAIHQPAAGDPQLVQAVRDYWEGRTDRAIERLRDLDATNQEMVLRLLPALVHAIRADLSGRSPTDAAVLASQLEAATEAAQRRSPLRVRNSCFAWRVTQFGVYDPVPEAHPFLPGGSGMLYLELQNVANMPTELPAGGQGFVTKLVCSMQIIDMDGKPVGPPKSFNHAEFTRSPVRDYFLKLEFDVPSVPGRYALIVEITDPAQRKVRHQAELLVKP